MVETRRRRPVDEDKPVSRRRDRIADDVEEDDDEDEVEATRAPRRTRSKTSTTRRRAEPVDEEDDDEEEEEAPPRRRKASTTKRRRPAPVDEDDEEEEEERPARRTKTKASTTRRRRPAPEEDDDEDDEPAPKRRRSSTKAALPPGVKTGAAGVEEVRSAGGSGVQRLKLGTEPELFKCLDVDPAPLVSFRQHWLPQGGGQPDRPEVCPGKKTCPLCDMGDNSSQSIAFNILHLSGSDEPEVKLLQVGIKAYNAFKDAATSRSATEPNFNKDFFSVSRSGKGGQSQTNFTPVKLRDIEEDWGEVLEHWDIEDIEDIIADAEEEMFEPADVVQVKSAKQLREVAKFLSED